jgi:ABC-type Fe3+-hydroxamate transport system substrate-binding protein
MAFRPHDDLGAAVDVQGPAERVVSLVPSLTEAVALTHAGALVGATHRCVRPSGLDVARIGPPDAPDLDAIAALEPDLVLASRQENSEDDIAELRELGLRVWVTDVRSVGQALHSLCRLFADALCWDNPQWLETAACEWSGPAPADSVSAAMVVARDPWVAVGASSFTADLASRVGLRNVFHHAAEPYVCTTVEQIAAHEPSIVMLLDDQYKFTPDDGPEAFDGFNCRLVDSRYLTWYGPSLVDARRRLVNQVRQAGLELVGV